MSILKLTPACKDYLWGGTKLITDYGKRYDGARLAETWELSGHPDGPSVLASGPDAGKSLADYLAAQLHGKTIGFGGSVTLDTMGLYDRLSADNTLFWHWKQPADEARAAAAHAQVYLTSANAIAETGEIVNIDGSGNRLASMLYGHEALYIVAGVNKLAPDLPAALDRARNIAAPRNARRLNCKTPCALSEPMRCHDCRSPARICKGFCVLTRPMGGVGRTEVLLIGETLGY